MAPQPTLIFVPGAWHGPETWHKVTSLLESGSSPFKCVCITLPSTITTTATMKDDISAVRTAILSETQQGHDVVVIVHSYGSLPGSSVLKGLTSITTSNQGRVTGYIALSTGFPQTGVAFLDPFDGIPPPQWVIDPSTTSAKIVVDARELFYHDLPEAEGHHWVKQLRTQGVKVLTEGGEDVHAGWKDLKEVWYVASKQDKALPIEVQRGMVEMARGQMREVGGEVVVREVDGGHSLMLSKAEEVVGVIREAVVAFGR